MMVGLKMIITASTDIQTPKLYEMKIDNGGSDSMVGSDARVLGNSQVMIFTQRRLYSFIASTTGSQLKSQTIPGLAGITILSS